MSKLQSILQQTIKNENQDKKQLVKINQRIKALLDIKKFQHQDKLSQYLRIKNKQAKIKRTKDLRKHHIVNIMDNQDIKQNKKMSIQSLKICSSGIDNQQKLSIKRNKSNNNQYNYNNNNNNPSSSSNKKGLNLLKEFQQQFTKGKMDSKYQQMLEEYIYDYVGVIDNNRQQFIKKATKDIKQKLFNYYLQQRQKNNVLKISVDDSKPLTLQSNQLSSIEISKHPNPYKHHMRVKSEDQIIKQYSQHRNTNTIPYILKSPSKFNKIQSQSIYQVYLNGMESIDQAKKINQKKRRIKQHSFLMKLKQFNSLGAKR